MSVALDANSNDQVGFQGQGLDFQDEGFSILNQRMIEISSGIFEDCKKLNIQEEIQVLFNIEDVTPNPHVRKNADTVILEIPLLFLIESLDFHPKTPVKQWIQRNFSQKQVTEKDLLNLKIFQIFIQDVRAAQKVKEFVIHHELADVILGHLEKPPTSSRQSKQREKEADLMAIELLGDSEGARYLFSIMAQFNIPPSHSHPSFAERLAYVKQV
jgi:hypothetical protein